MADNTAFSGKDSSILVGKETTFGAPVSCTKDLGIISDATVEEVEDKERIGSIGARNSQADVRTRFRISGTIDAVYQHARMLHLALGSATSAGTSPTTHTMTEADCIPSVTLQATKSFTASGLKKTIPGVKVDTLRLIAEKSASLKWSAKWMGKTINRTTTTASQTLDDIHPAVPSQMSVYTGADDANPTAELTMVQAFELEIANGLKPNEGINSIVVSELIAQERKYTGKLTFTASEATEAVKMISRIMGTDTAVAPADIQTETALKFYWTNGLTPRDTLLITLYGVTYDSLSDTYTKDDIAYNDMPFTAESLGSCVSEDDITNGLWW